MQNQASNSGLDEFINDKGRIANNSRLKTKADDPLIGKTIAGRYQILELIGSGGFGSVYKAKQLSLNKIIALKVLRSDYVEDRKIAARFQHEATITSHIHDAHIVSVFDHDVCNETKVVFIAMEYVPGQSLKEVNREKGLEAERSVEILIQLCKGIAAAHKENILHRDIKPSNIILTNYNDNPDFVKITDFGIGKVLDESEELKRLTLTATGEVMGTYQYMSPEQCKGEKVDYRSDIYSIGCVLFEILTGNPPFHGGPSVSVISRHVMEASPPLVLDSTNPVISKRLAAIAGKSLEKEPAARYQSADELRMDLEVVQNKFKQLRAGRTNAVLLAVEKLGLTLTQATKRLRSRTLSKGLSGTVLTVFLLLILLVGAAGVFFFSGSFTGTISADRDLSLRACIFPRSAMSYVLNHSWDSIKISPKNESANREELLDDILSAAETSRLSGNFSEAVDKYNDALVFSKKHNLQLENSSIGAEIQTHLAYCFMIGSDSINRAEEASLRALQICERCGLQNNPRFLLSYAILGECYHSLGDDKSADLYFDKFVHISHEHSIEQVSPLELALGNTYTAKYYREMNKAELADSLFQRAISYWQNLGEPAQFNLGCTYNGRALLEFKERDFKAAIQDLENAKNSLIRGNTDNHELAIVLFTLSDVLFAKHDLTAGINTRMEALRLWSSR